jgi:hypothetical protein
MKKILNEGNQINNVISSSGSGTVINYGSGSTSQKVTVPTVPVPVPQRWLKLVTKFLQSQLNIFKSSLMFTLFFF